MIEIVIASDNLHKVRELRGMLKQYKHLEVLSLRDFPEYHAPEETGQTFLENATAKATHAATTLNKFAIGDDSGLVVPYLKGAPGIHSRRYAGPNSTDAENREKLLRDIQALSEEDLNAYYECCLVLASPKGLLKQVAAKCEGTLVKTERGRNGFGYDPLFVKYDYDKTFSELDESIKNRISHRRKAVDKLIPWLETLN